MSLWAFRFLLWYICIMFTQPQNRFLFLWPLHIADIAIIAALVLHVFSLLSENRPLVRFGPATVLALILMAAGMLSQYMGAMQVSPAWNGYIDIMIKNSLALILVEAMCYSVERVWAVQMTMALGTLWWIKGGLRLSAAGATYAGDRIMGAAVSLIENPNGFAYLMCVFIPLYLYFFRQTPHKWVRWLWLLCALCAIYIALQTGSRTGFVVLLALALTLAPRMWLHHRKALLISVIAVPVIFSIISPGNVERFRTIGTSMRAFLAGEVKHIDELNQDEQSAQERWLKNHDTWRLIKAYPLFGVGINPDQARYAGEYPYATGEVHCEILMAGRQMGFFGMALYVGFISIMFIFGYRVYFRARSWPDVADMGWVFTRQAVVFIVGGSFAPTPWNAVSMIVAGSASALWMNARMRTAEVPQGA